MNFVYILGSPLLLLNQVKQMILQHNRITDPKFDNSVHK